MLRNVLDKKSCRENQNGPCMSNKDFPKIVPFMRKCGKIWLSRTAHGWQHNTAQAPCMLDNYYYYYYYYYYRHKFGRTSIVRCRYVILSLMVNLHW